MSLFEELKRRNVFRVGIAYVITAWLILQLSDIVLDNIEAPHWVMQAIMLLLAIGLLHGLLVWNGDILTLYSIVGTVVLACIGLDDRWLCC